MEQNEHDCSGGFSRVCGVRNGGVHAGFLVLEMSNKDCMLIGLSAFCVLLVAHAVLPFWVHAVGGLTGLAWFAYRYACYLEWCEKREKKR